MLSKKQKKTTDEKLVELYCTTGDHQYFTVLYTRYVEKVYRKCIRMTRNESLAQDYTQDIFLQVLQKLDRFQGRSMFSTWLYALTRNYCISQLRNCRTTAEEMSEESERIADESEDPAILEQRLSFLQQALSSMPVAEAELLVMKYYDDLEMTQIGIQLNINADAVKMRLKRLRDKLRNRMEALDDSNL